MHFSRFYGFDTIRTCDIEYFNWSRLEYMDELLATAAAASSGLNRAETLTSVGGIQKSNTANAISLALGTQLPTPTSQTVTGGGSTPANMSKKQKSLFSARRCVGLPSGSTCYLFVYVIFLSYLLSRFFFRNSVFDGSKDRLKIRTYYLSISANGVVYKFFPLVASEIRELVVVLKCVTVQVFCSVYSWARVFHIICFSATGRARNPWKNKCTLRLSFMLSKNSFVIRCC